MLWELNMTNFQKALIDSGLDSVELSTLLHLSRPTVIRWLNGTNLPAPIMQDAVLRTLRGD
jgi:hypothetical protein